MHTLCYVKSNLSTETYRPTLGTRDPICGKIVTGHWKNQKKKIHTQYFKLMVKPKAETDDLKKIKLRIIMCRILTNNNSVSLQ